MLIVAVAVRRSAIDLPDGAERGAQPEAEGQPGGEGPAEPVGQPRVGQPRLGDYVLLDRIASGGSGVVHRAWQVSLQRFVAIKLLGHAEPIEAERFVREARMAARLSHPHIVPIYEVGEHEGRQYLVMKYIDGLSMDKVRVDPRRAAALVCQAAGAIEYAHRNGIVHRDLKPHNLILDDGDHVWVTDFGTARSTKGGSTLTGAGNVLGTPAYMPPEQARGRRCDERSDVYSLGATLYELLTGRHPFAGTDELVLLMTRVLSADPVPPRRLNPRVPVDLETIVAKAMAKDPARRYQTAGELEDDLHRHLDGEPIRARPPGLLGEGVKWIRRHPVVSSALAFALALGLGGVFHTLSLERQLAENTLSEANALGAAGQWEAARSRYRQAASAFARVGVAGRGAGAGARVGPELGLLDADHHAPPPLLALDGHRGPVRGVAFLPDGRRALSAGDDGALRLWDLPLGRPIRSLVGHPGGIACLALSGDGRLALTGGREGTVRLWDVEGGRPVRTLVAGADPVVKVALSPDATRALSRTSKGKVQLWDLRTGTELRTLTVAVKRVIGLAFSPDGRLALTGRNIEERGAPVNTRASLWEVETGREVQTFGAFTSEIESVTISPDGRRVLTAGYDRLVSVWDLESGRRLLVMRGHLHGLTGAAFSPKDRIVVSGGQDNAVKLWDAEDGKLVRSFDTGDAVEALAVSPDGNFILTGGEGGVLKLWDLTVGQEVRMFSGHESAVFGLDFTPDARLAVSGGNDRTVRLWDVATGREIHTFKPESSTHSVAVSPDGRLIVSGGVQGNIRLWDLYGGHERQRFVGQTGAVRSVAFSPDGRLLLSGSESGEVKLWEVASGRELRGWKHTDEVRSVTFSPDGRLAVWVSFDGAITFWDVAAGRPWRVLRTPVPERLGAVGLSADGALAATGNDAKQVRLWDVASGRLLRTLEGHLGDVRAVRFSPDGRLVVSAGRDGSVRVWETETGRDLHAFTWMGDSVRAFAASRDGRFALAGADDGSMSLWDMGYVATYRQLEARAAEARSVLLRTPDNAQALAHLGEWYAFRGVSRWAIELLERAERGGARVSPLDLARCHWQEGDVTDARRELQRALAHQEAPADYLRLVLANIGSSEQASRLAQLNVKDGRVRFPYLGIRTRASTLDDPRWDAAQAARRPTSPSLRQRAPGSRRSYDDDLPAGALVTQVQAHTPAQRAGLRVGDIIIKADEQPIANDQMLGSYLASRPAGVAVNLSFLRDGTPRVTEAELSERPSRFWEPDPIQLTEERSGFALQTLTPELAAAFGLDPATQGAVVTAIDKQAPRDVATRILVEDIIAKVEGRPIATAEQAVAALGQLPPERWSRVEVIRPGSVR